MHSSSADWVFGEARLISSPTTTLAKIAPGRNSKSRASWLKTLTPVTSLGSRSGVNWMRRTVQSIERASALASIVLPTPGHVLDEQVALGEQHGDGGADDVRLALDHRVHRRGAARPTTWQHLVERRAPSRSAPGLVLGRSCVGRRPVAHGRIPVRRGSHVRRPVGAQRRLDLASPIAGSRQLRTVGCLLA